MSAHYESFMQPALHPHHHNSHHHHQHNGQQQQAHRYSYHHQGAPMLPEKGCWETENAIIPAGINEEFISLKSNDFSISVYHRYNGVAPTSCLDGLSNDQVINEPYNSHYNNGSNFTQACPSQSAVYSAAFHGATVPPAASRNTSGPSQAAQLGSSSRSLYMPPTPPSSEPGSPSQQQQLMQQSRAGVVHELQKQPSSGLIHTNQQQYVSSGETSVQTASRKQSPPPFSNGKQRQQQQSVSHFRHGENSSQVAPITVGSGNAPLHLSSSGTVPVPFGGQCSARSGEGKVSHSGSFGRNGQQQAQYNAAIVAQITAASHGVQPRYNRRNNPELEKRRIHRCDYPG